MAIVTMSLFTVTANRNNISPFQPKSTNELMLGTSDVWHVNCDKWHVHCEKWHVNCDTWHTACELWHVTYDMWTVTYDMWTVTSDLWHMNCDKWPRTRELWQMIRGNATPICNSGLKYQFQQNIHYSNTQVRKIRLLNIKVKCIMNANSQESYVTLGSILNTKGHVLEESVSSI